MYVGIYEMDLFENFYSFKPSLETMQLSSYHRDKGDIVELILDLNDIIRFNKIYLVKNRLTPNFPAELISDSRVELIGAGFHGTEYPGYFFDSAAPDRYIYNDFIEYLKNKRRLKDREKRHINNLQKCGYARLKIKDKINYNLPTENRICLYDNNLDNCDKGLDLINSKNYVKIIMMNEIYSENLETLVNWARPKWNHFKNKYVCSVEISDKEFLDYLKIANDLKVPVYFQIGNYKNGTISKLNFKLWIDRVLYAKSKGVKLKLFSVKNNFDYYTDLFAKLADWNNMNIRNKTFYQYFRDFYKVWRPTFETMLEKNKDIDRLVKVDIDKLVTKGGIYLYNGQV